MRRRRHSSASRTLFALGGLVIGALATGAGAPARADDAPPKFSATAGVRNFADPGDHVVVTVEVEALAFFDGAVEIVTPSGMVIRRPVEVAGGTTKKVYAIAPTAAPFEATTFTVQLATNGDVIGAERLTLRIASEVELVGVLPGMATRLGDIPDTVNLGNGADTAQMTAVDIETLSLGAAALDVYDTIIASSADLGSLGERLPAVLGWLHRGGRLVLDDTGDLSALPAEWRPGPSGYAWAGRGEVRIHSGAASAGRWVDIIHPSGSVNSSDFAAIQFLEGAFTLQADLAARSGVRLPSLTPVLVPLLVYGVSASLLLYIVLRVARRMTLAWVAIPLLALLTAGVVGGFGSTWRSTGRPTAVTLVDSYPGGGNAQLSLLTFSQRGGDARVSLPAGWQSDSEFNPAYGNAAQLVVTPGSDGTVFSTRLEPGQVVSTTLSGPTNDYGLTVQATVDAKGTSAVGTVTNRTTYALREVAVFTSGGAKLVGDLQSGESAEFVVKVGQPAPNANLPDQVWTRALDEVGQANDDDGSIAELGLWDVASSSQNLFPTAMVRAAGWTSEAPSDALGFNTITAVSSVAPVQPAADRVAAATVRTQAVRSATEQWGSRDVVLRYSLPPQADPNAGYELQVPLGAPDFQFWTGTKWLDGDEKGRVIAVPEVALRSGTVLVRAEQDDDQFLFLEVLPELRSRKADR